MLGVIIGIMSALWLGITLFIFKQCTMATKQTKEDAIDKLVQRFGDDQLLGYLEYAQEIEVKSLDDFRLKGYLFENDSQREGVVIISHGYTGNHYITLPFVPVYLELGFHVLLIEMRGHGESEGKGASYGYYESKDLDQWVKEIRRRFGQSIKVGLHGQSMGAATSLIYIQGNTDITFVVADCSYSDSQSLLKHQIKNIAKLPAGLFIPALKKMMYYSGGFKMEEASPIDAIANHDVPILFIHGDSDEIIPYQMSEQMYYKRNQKKDRLEIVKGAKHVEAYPTNSVQYVQALREFIACLRA